MICFLLASFLLTSYTPSEDGYLTGNKTRVSAETVEKYPRLTNLPALYITLDGDKELSDVQKAAYTAGTYTFVDENIGSSYYELPLSIKGRGNWSWGLEQKPYSLRLDDGADFLGMGEAKRWVLVTVHSDKTMMHNYITQKLAKWVGLPGTCDNEYVDVIVNGKYSGTYVLTEKAEFGKNRIDVPKAKGTLFEIERVYRHSCDICITLEENREDPSNSIHLTLLTYRGKNIDDLDVEERGEAKKTYRKFFQNAERAMKSGGMEELEKYMDVSTFVDWYLINELTRNYDSAFITSCYCYINEQGRLCMGPCWDYDTSYGIQFPETEGAWIQEAPWYDWLFRYSPSFVTLVRERWTELRENGIVEWFDAAVDEASEKIQQSEILQHARYPDSQMFNVSYDQAMYYFRYWLDRRFDWMDETFFVK